MDAQTILVILLSIGFIVLMGISISLLLILIRIMRSVQHITEKAEATTNNLQSIVRDAGRRMAPGIISSLVATVMRRARGRRR